MTAILILKTGALGDVLRTTSILPGLHLRYPGAEVTWVTAPAALDLVQGHPQVARTLSLRPDDADGARRLGVELGSAWERVISLDDELPLCALATVVADPKDRPGVLSGAWLRPDGERAYTPDVGPWFDMGLLSVHGKARADQLKLENTESHAAIYAAMLGIEMGEPELPLGAAAEAAGRTFAMRHGIDASRLWIGLNTGSGGRWESKKLSVERTVELARTLDAAHPEGLGFVLLGGPEERERNAAIGVALGEGLRWVDAGTDNALLDFAAIVDLLDLLVTSDSLALHVAVARRVPVLAFFAPTSAAEIELYGRGAKVWSTAPDYCSYARDADTSTLTVERLAPPALELLASRARSRTPGSDA
ncbi:glycosyltransferase family 9 protein [Engelhardtia mirabilis]|uniref:Lipopolysaccharide core biosynthesis protein n=1 Tax=Engelhardtia mirabilis TaxID=2528011 RepID=A0A518BPQ3_9BACT|nr:lipopolysaccharide core biosynthesis protein [Planctomycetes bacterium Pla133]QDV03285.1 lipopolysaccharide core biosynthesis protein [Planctomycetes bacterium Pla86]